MWLELNSYSPIFFDTLFNNYYSRKELQVKLKSTIWLALSIPKILGFAFRTANRLSYRINAITAK